MSTWPFLLCSAPPPCLEPHPSATSLFPPLLTLLSQARSCLWTGSLLGLRPNNSLLSGRLCLPYRDSTDGVWSLNVQLAISASLPFDLVLGHDWLQLSQTTLPYASFDLASGLLNVQATTQRTYYFPLFPCLSHGHKLPCGGRESSNSCSPFRYVLNML